MGIKSFMTKNRKLSPVLIPLCLSLPSLCLFIILYLAIADMFSKSYFMEHGFGRDLNYWTSEYRTKWYDGVLEVRGVLRDDKIVSEFIGVNPFEEPCLYIESRNKSYGEKCSIGVYGREEYGKADNMYYKHVVYYPEKKILLFIYAHTFI